MKLNNIVLIVLLAILFLLGGCVETVKEKSFQVVHVFTDLPDSLVKTVFEKFEKEKKIRIFWHFASSKYILKKLDAEKWESPADLVLLSNALDFNELTEKHVLQAQEKELDTLFWQPLFHNPFVFHFPADSVPLFTSYGQLLRNDKARVDATYIQSFEQWGNLISTLKQNYLIFSLDQIQNKILYSDSLKGKDILQIQIAPYNHFTKKEAITFPDQYFKGAVGIIGGIGRIRLSKNRSTADLLYAYCENQSFRKKIAQQLGLFPILDAEANKARDILLYQTPPIAAPIAAP